jgi:hypothetical protein
MSGQRIAAVIGLAVLTLFFASMGVLNLAVKACPPYDPLGYIPLSGSCASNASTVHGYGMMFLLFAVAAAIGALVTWASRPTADTSERRV